MNNPPILLAPRTIEKEIKPYVYNDIKGKSDEEVKAILEFYIKNCLNHKITNASYNYSHCRAVIQMICYFKDWDLPTDVAMNDVDRNVNQDLYYAEVTKKKAVVRGERKVKDEAACRTKASPEPIWVIKDVRNPNLPSVEQILKFNEARNSRT